jgi:hypothetical protein
VAIAFWISLLATESTRGANCNLAVASEKHQRLDNFLQQKFDHYWYGTQPTADYRSVPLREITRSLPTGTAVLFYELSSETDFIHPVEATVSRVPPQFMCVWLLDGIGRVIEVETPLDESDGRAILTLADDVRTSLAGNDDLRGWRAPERSKLVVATVEASLAPLIRPPSVVLGRASQFLLPEPIRRAIESREYGRLVIVPSRNFGDIPYAALPIKDKQQVIDFVSVVVMPSFAPLNQSPALFARLPLSASLERSLVVGDPEVVQSDKLVRRGMFAPLPGARDEAQEIAHVLGVEPLLGSEASQKALLKRITESNLIYLATHGVANDADPNDRSYLVLSDGALTARKIAKLHLPRHPIVVMSACQTGLGKTFESGVIGLAKAWKYAGASTVVMSLWSVYDVPTRNLMVEFITQLKNRQPPDVALQSAMMKLKTQPQYAHPAYWAGFMIYGTPAFNDGP